jgi:PAS domain S-box-containing protein
VAADALAGRERFGTASDYRGERVLAAVRRIRGTDWSLVAKVDEAEALAPHRQTVRAAGLALLALLGAAGATGLVLARSQRRVFEARVGQYEAHLASLLDHASDAILFVAEDGRILHANQRAARLYGYDLAGLRALRLRDLRGEPEPGRPDEAPMLGESVHRRSDGSPISVEVSSTVLEHEGERTQLAIVRDLREHKSAEALRQGELRILEMIASGVSLDETLDALVRLVETQSAGMRGSVLLVEAGRLRHAAAPSLAADFREVIDGEPIGPNRGSCGTSAYERRTVIVTDVSTDPRWEDYRDVALRFGLRACWSVPILGVDGTACGTFALYYGEPRSPTTDQLTLIERASHIAAIAIQRQRVERDLRASEAELRAMFDSAAIGIALVDAGGHPIKVNHALERFIGYSQAEMAKMAIPAFTHPEDHERDLADFAALKSGERRSLEREKRYVRKDGKVVWGRLSATLVFRGEGKEPLGLAMVEDVTMRRQLQQEVQQVQKMEAVGRLAGGIAHDFNNVLGVILGYGQMLRQAQQADPLQQARVDTILAAAERAARLTQQLLAFSRKQTFEQKVLDLNEVVGDLSKILHSLVGEDVKVEVAAGEELGHVRADRSQLDQILMNLVVNARDAMPTGGRIEIATRNIDLGQEFADTHPGSHRGRHVALAVSDTGCGMSAEVRDRLFEPFFTTKGPGKGTGLGLSTVYGIVKQSGGYISVDSEVGRGTRFDIYFPRVDGELTPETEAGSGRREGSETVLVVEDEDMLRELICEQVESYGYRVLNAGRPEVALRIAAEETGEIDLLLIDVVMPEMNGRELAERLKARRPRLRVLFMSGYTDDVLSRQGELVAGTHLLSKPFTGDALARKLREVLDQPS